MRNQDKHNDLNRKDIRDFLAQWLRRAELESNNMSVSALESEIGRLQKQLAAAKNRDAIHRLIRDNNWAEWDISGEIEDYNRETYTPFIGTEEEYKKIGERRSIRK